jgi:hypothetical protein
VEHVAGRPRLEITRAWRSSEALSGRAQALRSHQVLLSGSARDARAHALRARHGLRQDGFTPASQGGQHIVERNLTRLTVFVALLFAINTVVLFYQFD